MELGERKKRIESNVSLVRAGLVRLGRNVHTLELLNLRKLALGVVQKKRHFRRKGFHENAHGLFIAFSIDFNVKT